MKYAILGRLCSQLLRTKVGARERTAAAIHAILRRYSSKHSVGALVGSVVDAWLGVVLLRRRLRLRRRKGRTRDAQRM